MKKLPWECTYGCNKYNKAIEEIVTAGNKHWEKVLALMELTEQQKDGIRLLRNQKSQFEIRSINWKMTLDWRRTSFLPSRRTQQRKWVSLSKDYLKAKEELKRNNEK